MTQTLAALSLLVRDYDEAIAWYVDVLGFVLLEDTPRGPGKRWVRVAPRGARETCLLLAQAASDEQRAQVGRQGAGRVWLFLHTDDFARDYGRMRDAGVRFAEGPRHEEAARGAGV